ncbi:hypothetical protein H6A64_10550 [Lacrimispora saccharolytica]|nr:hypothetical protein [Lacrimispora saccharolytica]
MAKRSDRRVDSSERAERYPQDDYEEGSALRKLSAVPQELPGEYPEEQPVRRQRTAGRRARNAQITPRFLIGTVVLCAAMVAFVVGFLCLKEKIIEQNRHIASLENQINDLKSDNDAYYNKVMASVDLEAIREAAMDRLGMKYAEESQIQYYDTDGSSYVRQYQEVPQN